MKILDDDDFRRDLIGAFRGIAYAIQRLGTADAATPFGGLEQLAMAQQEGMESIATALQNIADKIDDLANVVKPDE